MYSYSPSKKNILFRIRWDNIFFASLIVFVFVLFFILMIKLSPISHDYEIYYIEYEIKQGDTLYNVVQDMNNYTPYGWNTYDFVHLAKKKNDIQDVRNIHVGEIILIPIAKQIH